MSRDSIRLPTDQLRYGPDTNQHGLDRSGIAPGNHLWLDGAPITVTAVWAGYGTPTRVDYVLGHTDLRAASPDDLAPEPQDKAKQ
ncbi:hypothetical protein [Mycobacteroides abscessus]|uniref:hypothetical protein n=1 Tax=Mycobacteroides abscessus TaxID=36809 RepID=UPI001041E9A5|nr:hypothetical protein [Mycobacteroides abscessus]